MEVVSMEDVEIVRSVNIESQSLPGTPEKNAGWIKRLIYPHNVNTKGIIMGIMEANPGYSIHRWHNHIRDKSEGYEVVYHKDFEEIYYVLKGGGVVQWKTQDGKIHEEKVIAGDTIFFPIGVGEHQLLNNSNEKILVLYCGSPIPRVTVTK